MPEGRTVGQMLDASGVDVGLAPWCEVRIDGKELSPIWWDRVKPKAGHCVTVSVVPRDSGSGVSNKTLRTVLQIAIVVIAAVATFYIGGVGGAVAGAAIAVGGNLAVQLLLPPSFPRRKSQEGSSISPSIAGARNEFPTFNQVVPRVLGRQRMFPPVVAA
jgi:hypothetical protein